MRNKRLAMKQKKALQGYIFILPWLIGFSFYGLYPFATSLKLSLSEIVKLTGFEMEFIGWGNYTRAFIWDVNFIPMFISAAKETFINTPIIIVISLFFSILLNRDIKGRGLFRAVFFLPVLLGTGYIMQELLGGGTTLQMTQTAQELANEATTAYTGGLARGITVPREILMYLGPKFADIVTMYLQRFTFLLWKSSVQIVLFLAGLQGIPASLYEAARCDGATEWEMFWKISLPMVSPVILLNVVYTIIDSFVDISNPIVRYLGNLGMTDFGYAAAIGWIYFSFILIVILLVFAIMKRFIYNAGQGRN